MDQFNGSKVSLLWEGHLPNSAEDTYPGLHVCRLGLVRVLLVRWHRRYLGCNQSCPLIVGVLFTVRGTHGWNVSDGRVVGHSCKILQINPDKINLRCYLTKKINK
jgi:hypothetical protein